MFWASAIVLLALIASCALAGCDCNCPAPMDCCTEVFNCSAGDNGPLLSSAAPSGLITLNGDLLVTQNYTSNTLVTITGDLIIDGNVSSVQLNSLYTVNGLSITNTSLTNATFPALSLIQNTLSVVTNPNLYVLSFTNNVTMVDSPSVLVSGNPLLCSICSLCPIAASNPNVASSGAPLLSSWTFFAEQCASGNPANCDLCLFTFSPTATPSGTATPSPTANATTTPSPSPSANATTSPTASITATPTTTLPTATPPPPSATPVSPSPSITPSTSVTPTSPQVTNMPGQAFLKLKIVTKGLNDVVSADAILSALSNAFTQESISESTVFLETSSQNGKSYSYTLKFVSTTDKQAFANAQSVQEALVAAGNLKGFCTPACASSKVRASRSSAASIAVAWALVVATLALAL